MAKEARLLELLRIDKPIIGRLQQLKTQPDALLEPSYEKNGKLASRRSIRQNIDIEDLISPIFAWHMIQVRETNAVVLAFPAFSTACMADSQMKSTSCRFYYRGVQ